jgi:hypothetical protein
MKTSFQIMDKTRNKTGTLCKSSSQHIFSSPTTKRPLMRIFAVSAGKRVWYKKARWFDLSRKHINNDLIDNDKMRAEKYGK